MQDKYLKMADLICGQIYRYMHRACVQSKQNVAKPDTGRLFIENTFTLQYLHFFIKNDNNARPLGAKLTECFIVSVAQVKKWTSKKNDVC